MKKGIHPEYRHLTIIMTDGSTYKAPLIIFKRLLKLDNDHKTHITWSYRKDHRLFDRGGRAEKFKQRFPDSSFFIFKKEKKS